MFATMHFQAMARNNAWSNHRQRDRAIEPKDARLSYSGTCRGCRRPISVVCREISRQLAAMRAYVDDNGLALPIECHMSVARQ